MTIREMRDRKRELGYTNEMISELSGVPLGTVQKLFAGFTKAPRRKTVEALERVLAAPPEQMKMPGKTNLYTDDRELVSASEVNEAGSGYTVTTIREAEPAYAVDPGQGSYTIEDYYALPDDRRVELIDGCFYDMAAPTWKHQTILGDIYYQLRPCVDKHPECRIFMAPVDVCLDSDNRTMVQPDILIVCNNKDRDIRRINGAPDFVIEVLSPSNRFHDMFRKLNKYRFSGVREYWIVDLEKSQVIVYDLAHDEPPVIYTFYDTVPLIISNGECSVDFEKISELLKQYGL